MGAALWRTFRSIGRLPLSQRILLILGNAARPAKGPIGELLNELGGGELFSANSQNWGNCTRLLMFF